MGYESKFYFVPVYRYDGKEHYGCVEICLDMAKINGQDFYKDKRAKNLNGEVYLKKLSDIFDYGDGEYDYNPTKEDAYGDKLKYMNLKDFKKYLIEKMQREDDFVRYWRVPLLMAIVDQLILNADNRYIVVHYGY